MPTKTLNYTEDNLPDYASEVITLNKTNVHSVTMDRASSSHFHNTGELLVDEFAILGQAVTSVIPVGDNANSKNIILNLIGFLESTTDVVQADITRKTLEIVLRYTADDA